MNNYVPTAVKATIYDIDFATLYANGKRVILFDLDNTLVPYNQKKPLKKQIDFMEYLNKIGYSIYILSNNNDKRIKEYAKEVAINGYLAKANKPFINKINKYLINQNINKDEIILVGDQLLTDILCANKLGVDSVLVRTICIDSQKWYTKINRTREKFVLRKIKKQNITIAIQIKELYERKDIV